MQAMSSLSNQPMFTLLHSHKLFPSHPLPPLPFLRSLMQAMSSLSNQAMFMPSNMSTAGCEPTDKVWGSEYVRGVAGKVVGWQASSGRRGKAVGVLLRRLTVLRRTGGASQHRCDLPDSNAPPLRSDPRRDSGPLLEECARLQASGLREDRRRGTRVPGVWMGPQGGGGGRGGTSTR